MKWIITAIFVGTVQMAWPQIQTGTSIVYNFSQSQFTIAADSRGVSAETGGHDNTQCKISAFGSKFVFSASGIVKKIDHWNAYTVARGIWQKELTGGQIDANKITAAVAEKWVTAMEGIYINDNIVSFRRKQMLPGEEPIIASAIFVATDKSGKIVGHVVDINFDLPLFDSTGTTRFVSRSDPINGPWGSLGLTEVFLEFGKRTTMRASEYMEWFMPQISTLNHSSQGIKLASKFVELTILLHPRNGEVGFPIDIMQFNGGTGVNWFTRKSKCPEN
jgi:hypothetical protein